jgi:uncharacterized protein
MVKSVAGFDWDDGNTEKCQKHGVSRSEVEAALGKRSTVAPDLKHSVDEQRFIAIERSQDDRPMFIAFTFRERDGVVWIRPVSARYMHKKEVAKYEKSTRNDN